MQKIVDAAPSFDPLLVERLVLFARRRLWKLTGRVLDRPEDYVHRAIELTLSGKRQRDPECPMFTHLTGIISSLVSHDVESAANRSTADWPSQATGEPIDFAAELPTPEEDIIARESEDQQNLVLGKVFQALSGEDDLCSFVRLLIDAPEALAPRDLADALHIPVDDVYLMRKRLRRRLRFLVEPEA